MVVTKGADGELSDGDIALQTKGAEDAFTGAIPAAEAQELALGKRFNSADGAVSVFVTKGGKCDLRYNGEPMELQEPRKLPSSD